MSNETKLNSLKKKLINTPNNKKQTYNLYNNIKDKLIEIGTDYAKNNIKTIQKDISKHIEKYVEYKIKKRIRLEIKKHTFLFISYLVLFLGIIFIMYFITQSLIILLNLPLITTNLIFGLLLIIISTLLYLMHI